MEISVFLIVALINLKIYLINNAPHVMLDAKNVFQLIQHHVLLATLHFSIILLQMNVEIHVHWASGKIVPIILALSVLALAINVFSLELELTVHNVLVVWQHSFNYMTKPI
jgi:hypothetical protein